MHFHIDETGSTVAPRPEKIEAVRSFGESQAKTPFEVMVVDDVASIGLVVKHLVLALGHRCRFAITAAEARDLMHRRAVEVVITDLQMPQIDGIRFARELREQSSRESLVIAGITSEPRLYRDVEQDLFDFQLSKPASSLDLKNMFRSIRRRKSHRPVG